jgi:hypothetical protein
MDNKMKEKPKCQKFVKSLRTLEKTFADTSDYIKTLVFFDYDYEQIRNNYKGQVLAVFYNESHVNYSSAMLDSVNKQILLHLLTRDLNVNTENLLFALFDYHTILKDLCELHIANYKERQQEAQLEV